VSVSDSATAFSFTCAGKPDLGIAITLPLRMAQVSATAAAEQPLLRQYVQAWDRAGSMLPKAPSPLSLYAIYRLPR
jgi:hypothetical protein